MLPAIPNISASSSASAQGGRSGDIGGSNFTFGGIQTGGSAGGVPVWVWGVALGVAALCAVIYFKRR